MDRGQSGAFNSGSAQTAGPQNYSYNQPQNDPFNSFINTEDDAAFDNTWQTPDFSSHQPSGSNNDYEPNPQHWHQTPYQSSGQNFLQIPQYPVDSNYPASDSIFQASNFDTPPAQEFAGRQNLAHQPYAPQSGFNPASLSNDPHYQYARSKDLETTSETISPAAITSYPEFSESSFPSNVRNLNYIRNTLLFTAVVAHDI